MIIRVIRDERMRRDRNGGLTRSYTLCLQRGDLFLAGNVLSKGDRRTSLPHAAVTQVMIALMLREKNPVSREEFISILWPNPDLEPEDPDKQVYMYLTAARRALLRVGAKLITYPTRGWEVCVSP